MGLKAQGSFTGHRDASVVRSARAQAGYHRRSPSVTRSHWPAFGKWPSPQRQLKKKSPTSSCLETVGYVVTARNPVPRISLFLLDPKGSLRFAPGFHPTSNPFCALRAGDFHSNFFGFWPPRGKACYYFIYCQEKKAQLSGKHGSGKTPTPPEGLSCLLTLYTASGGCRTCKDPHPLGSWT